MKLEQLAYTPEHTLTSDEKPHTYVIFVDEDMYEKYQRDSSVPMVNVVDSFDVFKYELPGRSGKLVHPSRREVEDDFGLKNMDDVVAFMLKNGKRAKEM